MAVMTDRTVDRSQILDPLRFQDLRSVGMKTVGGNILFLTSTPACH